MTAAAAPPVGHTLGQVEGMLLLIVVLAVLTVGRCALHARRRRQRRARWQEHARRYKPVEPAEATPRDFRG